MYKILFIDEQKESHDDFLAYVGLSTATDIKPIVMFPKENIEETIDAIEIENPDAVIADFELREYKIGSQESHYTVTYTGVELLSRLQLKRDGFPCFIMTSFDDKAVHDSEDVNIVYVKNILHNSEEKAKITFLDRVKEQIQHYRIRIANTESELKQLIELRNSGNATIDDESRLIELDTFLEKSLDGRTAIPTEYKSLSNQKQLSDLLEGVDSLIKKLEENK